MGSARVGRLVLERPVLRVSHRARQALAEGAQHRAQVDQLAFKHLADASAQRPGLLIGSSALGYQQGLGAA